ncbi:hypothetical protein MC885_018819 [Smutsia gigantea]|nr:hypothetical protein MC885_018819 [Smutsia gigantea]
MASQNDHRLSVQTFSGLPKPETTPWMILNVAENSGGKSEKRCAWKQKGKLLTCVDTAIVLFALNKISCVIPIAQKNREDQVFPFKPKKAFGITVKLQSRDADLFKIPEPAYAEQIPEQMKLSVQIAVAVD